MKKIALIGGSGFVGTRLIDLLQQEKGEYEIRNIDLVQSQFFPALTQIGDVREQAQMDKALAGAEAVVLLAAQHRDDVQPTSLYYDTNVGGMEVTLRAMAHCGIKRLVFFSSVAVYGLNKDNPSEAHPVDPFNHYGKSKWQAELKLREWSATHPDWQIDVVRPTVIFGERNRGNVYNLLRQIASGRFLMVGCGENRKSMAYVGNIVAFVKYLLAHPTAGCRTHNYTDRPDNTMNELVSHVGKVLGRHIPATHIPYWLGMIGGRCFDLLAAITGRKLTISSVRVKKFCATTQFDSTAAHACGFKAPFTLNEGLARTLEFEFVHPRTDDITFKTE